MQLLAPLFLPTYPDPPRPKIASLDAAVINVDIPDVSNALPSFLLDLPAKNREVKAASRDRGKALPEKATAEAARRKVTLTTQELKAQPALIENPPPRRDAILTSA